MKLNLKNRKIFDTLKIARKYVDAPNHKLETMIYEFDIEVDKRHRATDDSIATGELFLKLIDIAKG
jgi:DNA polymerase III alpha subunit (gram-positive type)